MKPNNNKQAKTEIQLSATYESERMNQPADRGD